MFFIQFNTKIIISFSCQFRIIILIQISTQILQQTKITPIPCIKFVYNQNQPQNYMQGIAAAGFCCCLDLCCKSLNDSLLQWLGRQRLSKVYYISLIIIFVVPAIVIFFFLNRWKSFLDYFQRWFSCPASSGSGFQCIGSSAIYRLSLSLLCLFVLMMILMLCFNRCSQIINEGLFCIKYLLVVGLFIGFLWINNSVFEDYSQASQGISIAFMILQAIILIDLFYMASIKLVKRYDAGQTRCAGFLIFLTILAFGAAITLNVLGYTEFNDSPCGSTLWVNIINTIIIIALPALQFLNFNSQNSLFTTGLVCMYVSYLAFISQYSYIGNNSCTRMTVEALIADVVVSTFFFILTLYGSIQGGSGQVKISANGDINKAMGVAPKTDRQDQKYEQQQIRNQLKKQNNQTQVSPNYTSWVWVKWHFYMSLASIYVGMLITNWGSASIITGDLQSSGFGFWVRVCLSWGASFLYIWTLIAPRIFPDRNFVVE